MRKIKFEELVGETGSLYLNTDTNRFQIGSCIFEAIENPDDGYRSMMDEIVLVTDQAQKIGSPLASIEITKSSDNSFDGYKIVDLEDSHIWLKIGTDESDSYYPYFVFEWTPKKPIEEQKEENTINIKDKLK